MDDTVKLIVHASCFLVFLEGIWRIFFHDELFWMEGGLLFFAFYIGCIVASIIGFKDFGFLQSNLFKSILSTLHGLDGLAALVIE
jgi:hypothetical protein